MKLTKSQRLFMAAGQVQNELMLQKAYYAPWDDDREECGKHIKEYKARRKKLIRAALRAYELEIADAFTAGYEMCKSAHNISDEFMLVDGDVIF